MPASALGCRMKVILYSKTGCPWAEAVKNLLEERDVPYEERDMTQNPDYAREAEEKSGETTSPTLDIDGRIIADADVEDVVKALDERGVAD